MTPTFVLFFLGMCNFEVSGAAIKCVPLHEGMCAGMCCNCLCVWALGGTVCGYSALDVIQIAHWECCRAAISTEI